MATHIQPLRYGPQTTQVYSVSRTSPPGISLGAVPGRNLQS